MLGGLVELYCLFHYGCIRVGFALRYWHHGVSWGDAMEMAAVDIDQLLDNQIRALTAEKRRLEEEAKRSGEDA